MYMIKKDKVFFSDSDGTTDGLFSYPDDRFKKCTTLQSVGPYSCLSQDGFDIWDEYDLIM
jgi:hypothetical protein